MSNLPQEPARRSTLSRRGVLKGGGVVAFAGVSLAALKLPFFGVDGAVQDPLTCKATDVSSSDPSLTISNWTGYIDPPNPTGSTMHRFNDATGIDVTYNVDINDNAEFYAKVKNQLGECEPIDRDMMILTDWMAARMIGLGWVQPLDADAVPNVHSNLIKSLQGVAWDPDLTYHAPWQSGLTGIAYNAAKVDEVGSFEDLITRSDLKGKITLLSEMPDTMGFMLKVTGADPENFDDADWDNAMDRLTQVIEDGQVLQFSGNNYLQQLAQGNLYACEAWSGDVIAMQYDNPDIKWVVPEEGLSLWSDNMMVPNKADHKANAEALMNHYYDPEVAATLAAWVNYICPVAGAQEAMEKIDPSLVDNPLIFPDKAFLANAYGFMELDEKTRQQYDKDFAKVIGA